MGKTPKEIREASAGVAARDNVVHSSTSTSDNESIGVLSEDVSRIQGAVHDFDMNLSYKIDDTVKEGGLLFRSRVNQSAGAFIITRWEVVDEHTLQKAYDGDERIFTDDGRPIRIIGPSSDLFQPLVEFEDQNSKLPLTFNAGGEIEQQPFNLRTVAIVDQGDNNASLVSSTHLETHSRFLFVNTEEGSGEGVEIFSLANPELPRHIGLISDASLTKPNMFKMHGDILHVLDGSATAKLLMFDIGNPSVPKLLGTITSGDIGTTFDADSQMIVEGKYIFLTNKGTTPATTFVNVIDITDPTAPILINKITNGESGTTGGNYVLDQIGAMAIHENFMFLANHGTDSIELLDISDLTDILHISNIADGAGGALLTEVIKISATRDVIFFSSFTDKSLQAIDYSIPTAPVLADSFKDGDDGVTLGNVTDSDVAGRYFYFYSAIGGVQSITTFDIQDADNIKFLQTSMIEALVPLIGTGTTGLAITGDHIYGLNSGATSQLYAVRLSGSDVQSTRVGSARFGNADIKDSLTARNLDVSESANFGTRGILVNGPISGQESATIKAVDAFPVKIISPDTPASVFQSVLEIRDQNDDLPIKIEGSGEFEQVPFNIKLASTVNGSASSLANSSRLEVHSRFLFIDNSAVSPNNGVEIFSISNPEGPVFLNNLTAFFTVAGNFAHHGDILYVIDIDGGVATLRAIDIGNPTDPKELGSFTSGTDGSSFTNGFFTIQASTAYLVDNSADKVTILDISDPANMQVIKVISDAEVTPGGNIVLSNPQIAKVHENFLFIYNLSATESVECIDISDPTNPSHLSNIVDGGGSAPFLDSVVNFHVTRDVAHFCNTTSKSIQTIDYSDPTSPTVKDSIKDGDAGVSIDTITDCVIAGRYAYILNQDTSSKDVKIATIDLQDADNLVFLQNNTILNDTAGMGKMAITGDHIYFTNRADPTGKLYSLRNSGIESQSMRVGAGRFGDLDVKDMTTCRLADISESLHVGGRGILSNGPISGQKSATIKSVDTVPVKIISPDSPASVFQSVLEIRDQDGNIPLKIDGSGYIEQLPANLELRKTINNGDNGILLSSPRSIDLHSRFLFIGNVNAPNRGLEIVSITNPEEPEHVNLVAPSGSFFTSDIVNMKHHGDIVYIVSIESLVNTFSMLDITNPHSPITLGSIANDVSSGGIKIGRHFVVQGKYVFMTTGATAASGDPGITILDISDPTNIIRVTEVTDGDTGSTGGSIVLDSPTVMALHEGFLWAFNANLIGNSDVECIDISDLTDIKHLSNVENGNGTPGNAPHIGSVLTIHPTRDVVHFFSKAFASNKSALQVIDYADPSSPVVRDAIVDGVDATLGLVESGEVAGKFAYILSTESLMANVTTVDVQDADNLIVIQTTPISTSVLTGEEFVISGDHAFIIDTGSVNGKIFSLRLSGIESHAARIGDMRVALLDVKDEMSARLVDVSESLHVGTRGILSNGPIAGQAGSNIKREAIDIALDGDGLSIDFDMVEDITVYDLDATLMDNTFTAGVTNARVGHVVIIQIHDIVNGGETNELDFSDAIFDNPTTFSDKIDGTVSAQGWARLTCIREDGSANSIIAEVHNT